MAHYQVYQCPDCDGKFKFLHHPDDAPPPNRCPLCDSWVSEDEPMEPAFMPQAPGIRKSTYAKSVDESYRAMETASIQRADDAADQLEAAYRQQEKAEPHEGDRRVLDDLEKNQIAELRSGLKVTNMQDPTSLRHGDTSAVGGSASEAAKRLSIGPSKPEYQNLGGGRPPEYAPGVGPKNSGDIARQAILGSHGSRAAAMIQAGQMHPAYASKR